MHIAGLGLCFSLLILEPYALFRLVTPSSTVSALQDPIVTGVSPRRGPKAGGTSLTITGLSLLTGRPSEVSVVVGTVPCLM